MIAAGRSRAAPLAVAALLLAGCATRLPAPPGAERVSGRLSIRVDAMPQQPAQRVSALFDLAGSPTEGSLALSSPALGTTLAEATWTAQGAELRTSSGVTRHAGLDELSEQMLGQRLPMAALMSWLRGRPWPGAPHADQPAGFEQLGWRVDLGHWAEGELTAWRLAPPRLQVTVQRDLTEP